jgi:NADP-reducing hydrogenase subunit HndA
MHLKIYNASDNIKSDIHDKRHVCHEKQIRFNECIIGNKNGGVNLENKKTVPFRGTQEQEAELHQMIAELKDQKGSLMPIMQKAQGIYGYLPYEVQKMISDDTGVPMAKIYGVATFYSMFNLYPKGKYQISVCLGTACYVKGSGAVYEKLSEKLQISGGECTEDGKFSLDACRCIGACGLAPVMMINDQVYGRLTVDELDGILAKYD